MFKRLWIYAAILLGLAFLIFGYFWFEDWKFRQETLKELGPFFEDEKEQKDQLLALGEIDLNPSDLTLATLRQKLGSAVKKQPGDFNTTRLGWVCGKERCAIWASFLVPLGQDIPSNTAPAGLVINSPVLGDFPNIRVGEIRLGESDQKLVQLWEGGGTASKKVYHRISWDQDWTAAWGGLDGKVYILIFTNDMLLDRFARESQSATPAATK